MSFLNLNFESLKQNEEEKEEMIVTNPLLLKIMVLKGKFEVLNEIEESFEQKSSRLFGFQIKDETKQLRNSRSPL